MRISCLHIDSECHYLGGVSFVACNSSLTFGGKSAGPADRINGTTGGVPWGHRGIRMAASPPYGEKD